MRFFRFLLAAVCALAVLPSAAVRAFDVPTFDPGNNAPMPAAVVQLYTDLNTIPPGTAATDAQHQALVADLGALATGIFTPDPADIDQLATDLATAATNGLFSDNVLEYLADDFIGDPDDPTADPDGWMDDIQDDVASLIDPPPFLGDPGDPLDPTIYELGATNAAVFANESSHRVSVPLTAQNLMPYLLESYSGSARLQTRTVAGGVAVNMLRVQTLGLPPGNPYIVSITRRSDGASVPVGKLRVHGNPVLFAIDVSSSAGAKPQAEFSSVGDVRFGGGNVKKPLPAGFDGADVATVTVTDSQGVVCLAGAVANGTPTSQVQACKVGLDGTTTDPTRIPSGHVSARHKTTASATTDRFRLLARHLPANALVTLNADGVAVGQYNTTAGGRLFIVEGFQPTRLNHHGVAPAVNVLARGTNLAGAKSFTLTDAQGTVLLGGSLD